MADRFLIVTADDFGASKGVNRGIIDAHTRGVVTSTSLMVHGVAAEDAAKLAAAHPSLALGLHWDLDGKQAPVIDLEDPAAVREELSCQLELFHQLTGGPPTHIDSHHHVHREDHIAPIARELAATLGVPLRHESRVTYIGGFYGQWEWEVTDLSHVSPEFFIWILHNEVAEGWTEIGCHPGYPSDDFTSVYLAEREVEVSTLIDPRVRAEVDALDLQLVSYRDFPSGA
jgi:predicted glycoside hydrolase/deacetylase ChbG (UPF0249 family)